MNNQFISDSAAQGAAFLDQKLSNIKKADVTDVTGVTINKHAASSGNVTKDTGVTDVTSPKIPNNTECPKFVCFDEKTQDGNNKMQPGVWYFEVKEGTRSSKRVCSPLHIKATTYDSQENNYGRLLSFKTTSGGWREWSMPMELLKGGGDEMRGELLAMGVEIQPGTSARNLLSMYLQTNPPKLKIQCALQVGWCGDSFVLPDKVYGRDSDTIIFQSGERARDEFTQAGTVEGWREKIALRAIQNTILTVAISAAFAAPLSKKCNAESGGLHFVGNSSIGKSSAIDAACSVWGGENFKRSWKTTANGLEGAAVLFNDCLLALDEIGECDPREIGAIVYSLGNGRGKQRATRSGSARGVSRWRSFVLSTGERTISTAMSEGGYRSKAGQSVRILDVPSERAHGIYDELHGYESGQALSDSLKKYSIEQCGIVGRAFLQKLTLDTRDFNERIERIKGLAQFQATEPQHRRAAARFALVGLAGELATEYGLTGWQEGGAIKAASECFKLWRNCRGKGSDERQQILEQLSDFIERHEDSRFSRIDGLRDVQIRDKAGWKEVRDEINFYLFNSGGMKEALKGFDLKKSLDVLVEAGVLPEPTSGGERQKQRKINGINTKVYQINAKRLCEVTDESR